MSHEQSAWLSEKMDGFQLSQLQGTVSTYLSEANVQWFAKWPESAVHFKDETGIGLMEEQLSKEQHVSLGAHIKQHKSQLRSYFYCNASATGRARVTQFTKTIMKLMGSSTKCTHGPTAVEHFIHTKYQSGTLVKEKIESHLKNGEYSRQNRMSGLRTEAAKAMTARGEEYVKKMELEAKMECERHAEKVKAELEALRNPDESAQVQYIEGLGAIVGQLLQTIQQTTGWYGSIYLGGPDPRVAGDVRVFSFHHGKGSTGLSFCEVLADHHTCVVEPFTTFLKGAFATQVFSSCPNTTNPVPLDVILPVDTQVSDAPSDHSIINPPSAAITQYTHASSTAHSVLPAEIRQPPQDKSFDNSLGFFGTSLESFMMSDDTLYEGNASAGASVEPLVMSDDTLYKIGPEDNVNSWQTSLPMLPPYPGQLTPPCLCGAMARLGSGSVNHFHRPRPRPYTGKTNSIYDRFRDSPPSSPIPSWATQTPSLTEAIVTSPLAALVLPLTGSSPPAAASSPTAVRLLTPSPLPAALTTSPAALTTSPTSKTMSPAPETVSLASDTASPACESASPASKASQGPALVMSSSEPLEDITNQSVRHSSRTHVPSTHLTVANSIGSDKRA
ncbi:hypothetical protein BDR03DRAFT_1016620 [Suillus americanus]|nr:hypothetical protein BDR03DRAFT_1016620 [Suillus americanus]